MAVAFVVLIALGSLIGVWAWQADQAATARMRHAWDAGHGRPTAAIVVPGQTVRVPASIGQVNQYWDTCIFSTCYSASLGRYPKVFPIGSLEPNDHGCYTDDLPDRVGRIMAATTTRGGRYSVHLGSNGTTLTICSITRQHDDDQIAIWSDATAGSPT